MNEAKRLRKGFIVAVAMMLVCFTSGAAMAANKLIVKDSAGTVDKFVVTDSGYVGVGTSSPSSGQHLKGSSIAATQIISQFAGGSQTLSGGQVFLRNQSAGALPVNGDRLGYILFGGLDCSQSGSTDGCTPKYSSGFFAYADGNWTSTSTPSYYVFETTRTGTASRNEWMRITSYGNIGIGTPSPQANLEVNGGIRLNPRSVPSTSTSAARTAPSKPVCDNINGPNIRGTFWFTKDDRAGFPDKLEICRKRADDSYEWTAIIN